MQGLIVMGVCVDLKKGSCCDNEFDDLMVFLGCMAVMHDAAMTIPI